MISYKDRTFCTNPFCTCSRQLTPEIIRDAMIWWGAAGAPISMSNMCGGEAPSTSALKHHLETLFNTGYDLYQKHFSEMTKECHACGREYINPKEVVLRTHPAQGLEFTEEDPNWKKEKE